MFFNSNISIKIFFEQITKARAIVIVITLIINLAFFMWPGPILMPLINVLVFLNF